MARREKSPSPLEAARGLRARDDIHTATAAEVLGKDPATLTTGERSVAKMINFGIIYGISAFGLSENLEIPREEAQAVYRRVPGALPARPGLHPADDRAGAPRRLRHEPARAAPPGARDPRLEPTDALARRAARRQLRHAGLERGHHQGGDDPHPRAAAAEGRGARLVLQIHDELLLEVPETEVSAVRDLVREEMCGAYPLDPPLAVDVGVGDDWDEAKR